MSSRTVAPATSLEADPLPATRGFDAYARDLDRRAGENNFELDAHSGRDRNILLRGRVPEPEDAEAITAGSHLRHAEEPEPVALCQPLHRVLTEQNHGRCVNGGTLLVAHSTVDCAPLLGQSARR